MNNFHHNFLDHRLNDFDDFDHDNDFADIRGHQAHQQAGIHSPAHSPVRRNPWQSQVPFSIYFIHLRWSTNLMVFQVHRKNQRASPPAHVAWQTLIRAEGSKGKEGSKADGGRNLPGEISVFQASIMGKGCSLILTKRLSYPTPIKKHLLSPPTFPSLGLSLLQSSPTQPR